MGLSGACCTDARLYALRIKIGTRTTSAKNARIVELASDIASAFGDIAPKMHFTILYLLTLSKNEPRHEIFNNVVCATSKASDQPARTRILVRAFAIRLNLL